MTDSAGNVLNLDQNAIEENGLIYVPNAAAVIKDGQVFIPNLLAVKDEATGNYYTDSSKLTQIADVILNGTQVMTLDPTGIDKLATDGVTQIAYTVDPLG